MKTRHGRFLSWQIFFLLFYLQLDGYKCQIWGKNLGLWLVQGERCLIAALRKMPGFGWGGVKDPASPWNSTVGWLRQVLAHCICFCGYWSSSSWKASVLTPTSWLPFSDLAAQHSASQCGSPLWESDPEMRVPCYIYTSFVLGGKGLRTWVTEVLWKMRSFRRICPLPNFRWLDMVELWQSGLLISDCVVSWHKSVWFEVFVSAELI